MNPNIDTSRHKELFDPSTFNKEIHIIGAGATGSWLAFSLAKLGLDNIHVYDFDRVEEHNIANQLYSLSDVGVYKVNALKAIIQASTGCKIKTHIKEVKEENFSGIVFMMIDTMSGRKAIYESSIKYKLNVALMIEPRMGLHMGRIYNVKPMSLSLLKQYEKTLYGDAEAEVSACGNSMSVISSALVITGWCVRQLINFHVGETLSSEVLIDFQNNNMFANYWE